jgi:hypothetical protein
MCNENRTSFASATRELIRERRVLACLRHVPGDDKGGRPPRGDTIGPELKTRPFNLNLRVRSSRLELGEMVMDFARRIE